MAEAGGIDHIARLAAGYDFSGMSDAELVGDMRGFNAAARTIRVDVACALAVALMLEAAKRLEGSPGDGGGHLDRGLEAGNDDG